MKPPLPHKQLERMACLHAKELQDGIRNSLNIIIQNYNDDIRADLCQSLVDNLYKILSETPKKLHDLEMRNHWVDQLFAITLNWNNFADELLTAFNYSNFQRRKGYEFVSSIGYAVCPYCNMDHIAVLPHSPDDPGRFRPDIDHWFPKSIYPWFSVSFFNMVPSCLPCNLRLKRTTEWSYAEYAHPYVDDIDKSVRFKVCAPSNSNHERGWPKLCIPSNKQLDASIRIAKRGSETRAKRSENFIEAMHLRKRYLYNKRPIQDLLDRLMRYPLTKWNDLFCMMNDGNIDKEVFATLRQLFWRSTGYDNDVHTRSYGKILNDIVRQYLEAEGSLLES